MLFFENNFDAADKVQFVISYLLRASLVIAAVEALVTAKWVILFVSIAVLILTFVPSLIARNYKFHLPIELEVVTIAFIYAAIFLGEAYKYYLKFPWWDVMLHAISGVIIGFIGFLILYILYRHDKVDARPLTIAAFAFCFAVAIGTLWEIAEFTIDGVFGTSMQETGLVDTMWDLILDSGGALFVSFIGYGYIKKQREGKNTAGLVDRIVRKFFAKNPKL